MLEGDRPDVCVIGAGPTGLLLALALARCGHEVTVLERRAALLPQTPPAGAAGPGPGGAPNLQPVTLGLLDAAGVLDQVRPVSARIDGAEVYVNGTLVAARDYAAVPGVPVPYAMSVPMIALTQALLQRLERESNVHLLLGVTVHLDPCPDGRFAVRVRRGEQETRVEPRVIAACDGKHSAARGMAGIDAEVFSFESGYVEVPLAMPPDWGARIRAHITERGYVLATPVAGPELLLVWIAEPRLVAETLSRGAAEVADALVAQVPSLASALDGREVAPRTVPHHIVRPRQWARGNLVLVGDSAHGLHAMGGQGLNTSLQDAICTAIALDDMVRTGDDSALRDFHAVRRPFIEAFQDQQRQRATGQHDLPMLDLDILALGQPELREMFAAASAVFDFAGAR